MADMRGTLPQTVAASIRGVITDVAGRYADGKMLLHSAKQTTRDDQEEDICVRVVCDLLSDTPTPPGDRKPGDSGMSDRRGRGEMAAKTGGR